jgi:hypothetical protein
MMIKQYLQPLFLLLHIDVPHLFSITFLSLFSNCRFPNLFSAKPCQYFQKLFLNRFSAIPSVP